MQLACPFSRHTFAIIVPHKRCIHTSSIHSALRRLSEDDVDGTTLSERDSGRFQRRNKAFLYTSGLGIASTTLYYIFANGPSRSAPTSSTAPLSPTHFTPVTLTATISCTPYTKLLTLSLPPHLIPGVEAHTSPIFSIYVKDSDIQVERPYTPLEGIDAQGRMHFWVKRYQGGEVGRWLHERKVGDQIEVRGPVPNWNWRDGEWDEIIMISGGTGVTPFYQLLYSIFSSTSRSTPLRTRFTLLHSSPTPLDLPPPSLLDTLQSFAQLYPESFCLRFYVDTADPKPFRQDLPKFTIGRVGRKALERALADTSTKADSWWNKLWLSTRGPDTTRRKILFIVCGPEPMISAIAGSRARNLTQGSVRGVLGEMGFGSHQVVKL